MVRSTRRHPLPIVAVSVLCLSMLIVSVGGSSTASLSQPNTQVSINGDRFQINGTDTFLLGVSYFDVSNWRISDLDRFVDHKLNLVRVWLDWSLMDGTSRSMFEQSTGSIPKRNQSLIRDFVLACGTRGIVVDVTILESGSRVAEPETAVRNAIRLLRDAPNVLFDLVNEHNNRPWSSSHEKMTVLVKAAKEEGPGKIIFYSSWETHLLSRDPARVQRGGLGDEVRSGVMAVVPHLLRTPDWWSQTPTRVKALKNSLASMGRAIPIYLSEENRRGGHYINSSAQEFLRAEQTAKEAGAAGWIFHTQAGFDMAKEDFFARLDPVERQVLAALGGQ